MTTRKNREALERVKAFAEAWATDSDMDAIALTEQDGTTVTRLLRVDLNRITALAEQALDDQENPPRGGH